MENSICKCGKHFYGGKYRKNIFCSKECRYKYGEKRKSNTAVYCICKCGKNFKTNSYKISVSKGKYCSKSCMYEYCVRPIGLKYKKHKDNPTSFKKGESPWNKGLAGTGICKPTNGSIKIGERRSISTEFKNGQTKNEKNNNWKGDNVGYHSLHAWVSRRIQRPKTCSFCGLEHKNIDLANKSNMYKRDVGDWIWLCRKCHFKYDRENGFWGNATKKFKL